MLQREWKLSKMCFPATSKEVCAVSVPTSLSLIFPLPKFCNEKQKSKQQKMRARKRNSLNAFSVAPSQIFFFIALLWDFYANLMTLLCLNLRFFPLPFNPR
jgi:hypothetical protein